MRDIKFRAWDKEEGKMIPAIHTFISTSKWEIMQFTGLRDKNGLTEVYDGDIIDTDGIVRGNVYESPQIYREGIDIVVEGMGTKAWRSTESIAMGRGCKYPE